MTAESTSDQTRTNARPRRGGRDGGFTFVETVIAIVLMGIVIVPVLAAVRAAIRVSSVSEATAQVETSLVNAADKVQRAPANTCDFTTYAEDALPTTATPSDWQVALVQEYLEDPTGEWKSGTAVGPACPGGSPQQRVAKRITITVTSPDGRISRTIQVVKSDV